MKGMLSLVAILVGITCSVTASAYSWEPKPWCTQTVPAYKININSFTDRGLPYYASDQIIDAATVWNHMGENLSISKGSSSTTCRQPSTICAFNTNEDETLWLNPGYLAYTNVTTNSSCFVSYYQIYRADYGFGFTADTSSYSSDGFISTAMHEFGHSMSLGTLPLPGRECQHEMPLCRGTSLRPYLTVMTPRA